MLESFVAVSTLCLFGCLSVVALVLWRWPTARRQFSRRPALTLGLLASLTSLLARVVGAGQDWVTQNGYQWRGVCPGGPPDIGPHLCDVSSFLANTLLSPFAVFGILLFTMCWSVIWCAIGVLALLAQSPSGQSRLRVVVRAALAGISSVPIALVATVACQLLLTWSAQAALARTAARESTVDSADFIAAWGLNVRDPQQLTPRTVSLADPLHGNTAVHFALQDGDARRVLARWPKHCWQATKTLPSWLFEPARTAVPPPRNSAPRLMAGLDNDGGESLVVLGMRLSKRGPSAAAPHWARTFAEARAGLEAGELAWEWFALEVLTTPGRNALHVQQRDYARDARDWQPICESDGTSIDALEHRPVVYGTLSGRVESNEKSQPDARRRRLASAQLLFAHEDGWTREKTESADDGSYVVRLPVGRYRVTITHPDYRPLEPGVGFTIVSPDPHYARYFLQAR